MELANELLEFLFVFEESDIDLVSQAPPPLLAVLLAVFDSFFLFKIDLHCLQLDVVVLGEAHSRLQTLLVPALLD